MKKTIFLLLFFAFGNSIFAQTWDFYDPSNSGIISNIVYSIAIDNNNNKWFGTNRGISKFDGNSWISYSTKNGLAGNYVWSITVDIQGNIWVATDNGISMYDGSNWNSYKVGTDVYSTAVDHQNIKWFGTSNGLLRFDGTNWESYSKVDGLCNYSIRDIFVDSYNNKWILTVCETVSKFDNTTWTTLNINQAQSIHIDKQNNVWVGTKSGIKIFDGISWKTYKPDKYIDSIKEDKHGNKWFISDVLLKFDGTNWTYIDYPENWFLNGFAIDEQDKKWIGTHGAGVFVLNDQHTANCNLSDLSTTSAYYDATVDLCSRNIISGSDSPTNLGAVNVTDTLKRKHLAKIAFRGLYLTNGRTIPTSLPSDNYPTVYDDLSTQTAENAYYYQPAKALLYLEYGDGVSPFDRNKTNFNPDNSIARVDVIKALLETFNIAPDLSNGTNPFLDDLDVIALKNNNPRKYGYILKAASLGIIATPSGDKNTKFRPFDKCLRGEAFVMLDRIIVAIENGTITDPNPQNSSYFEPLNVTLENLSLGLNQTNGNFNSYSKDVFSISGLMPMDFSFSYSSLATQLPDEFFGASDIGSGVIDTYKSLGSGWSHSYDMFANQVDDKYIVHWGGGKNDIYQKIVPTTGCPYFKPISKGNFDEAYMTYATNPCTDLGGTPGNNFVRQATKQENQYKENDILYIKTKSFITYKFIRLSSNIFQLSSIKDRNGNLIIINYQQGINNRMVISSITDGKRTLSFTYKTGTNLISTVSDPLNRKVTFSYSFNSTLNEYQLASFTDAKEQTTNYYYGQTNDINQSKLLTKIKKPNGNYIENQYDLNRRLTKTTTGYNNIPKSQTSIDLKTNYTNVNSTSTSSKVTTTIDGKDVSFNFDYNKNNCNTKITGVNDFNLNITYDEDSLLLPTTVQTKSSKVSMIYDAKGNIIQSQKVSLTNSNDALVVKMIYNDFNDIAEMQDALGNKTTYTYDWNGNLTGIFKPEGVETHFELNDKGQTIQKTDANGVITKYTYDENDQPNSLSIPSLNITSNTNYDIIGRLIEDSNFKNLTTSFQYDDNDNLTKEIKPLNTTTRWTYDPNDNLKTIVNAKGGVTSMNYDQTTDYLTSVTFGSSIRQYEYNTNGTVKKIIKPDGTVLTYSYDNLGNVTDDGICAYTYDNTNFKVSTIARKNGNVLSYEYDGFDRIKAVNYNDFANNKVQYEYDKNNNILSVTYPGNKKVSYTYDGLNRLKSVTDWNNKTITYNYRKDSQLQSIEYPNGMKTNYEYDAGGRMIAKTTKRTNGTIIAAYTNKLDSVGNITEAIKSEPYQDISIIEKEVNYSFDATNKILSAGDVKFEIDKNGNTTKRGNMVYTWYADDMLKSADGVVYDYDGLGNRRRNGNKRYFVDVMGIGNVIAETDASGTPTAYYIYGVGLEARILPNGTTEYYVSDNIGSTVAMVDASNSATITHKYQYDDFGNVTQSQENDFNPFRYIGRHGVMFDNDYLTYIRARYYDPTIGRFISEDPIWSTNLYSYTENNPINFIDIDGKTASNPNAVRSAAEFEAEISKGISKIERIIDKTKKAIEDIFKKKKDGSSGGSEMTQEAINKAKELYDVLIKNRQIIQKIISFSTTNYAIVLLTDAIRKDLNKAIFLLAAGYTIYQVIILVPTVSVFLLALI